MFGKRNEKSEEPKNKPTMLYESKQLVLVHQAPMETAEFAKYIEEHYLRHAWKIAGFSSNRSKASGGAWTAEVLWLVKGYYQ